MGENYYIINTMKNLKINISRVFKVPNNIVRDRLIRLEGDFSLSSLMNTIGWKFVILSIGNIKKASARIRLYHKFSTYLLVMNKRHGSEFVVKYLKACNLAVSKFLAGQPLSSLRELEPDLPLPRLSKSGLPNIIGTRDRRSLAANSTKVIRLWLTLFSLYRVFIIPAKAKLNTITDPFTGDSESIKYMIDWFQQNAVIVLSGFIPSKIRLQDSFSISEKSSPSNSKSWLGMLTDISLLKNQPKLFASFMYIMERTCTRDLNLIFYKLSQLVPDVQSLSFYLLPMKELFKEHFDAPRMINSFGLGQLHQKVEPAGKMRTFALVDSWTQTILLPLHNYITGILANIPNDGTKSHNDAFDRARQRAQEFGCAYGYDLSAATDRLPLSLQVAILTSLFDSVFSNHWANLLVGRSYWLFSKEFGWVDYKYSVGQPMGARSSFAMLGLTHHMLVQFAALRMTGATDFTWESRYEIVGDDIIIFNKELAEEYLVVMSDIGVPINMSKSVVSVNKPVVEFVKRVSVNGVDVSPFSWKQFISENFYLGRINTVIALFNKDISLAKYAVSVFHTVLKEKIFDSRPQKDILPHISLFLTYAMKIGMTRQEIMRILFLGKPLIANRVFRWEKFSFNTYFSNLKKMIIDGVSPVDLKYHPDFTIIEHHMKDIYAKQALRIMTKYNVYYIENLQERIINTLLGSLDLSREINKDIFNLLKKWMELQDPIFGDRGYPWYPKESDDFRIINPEDFDPDFILKMKLQFLQQYEERYKNWFNYLIMEKFVDNPLAATEQFLTECQGKISFLDIPNRIDTVEKPRLVDVKDHAFLANLYNVFNKIQKERGDVIRLDYKETPPVKYYFPKIQRWLGWI